MAVERKKVPEDEAVAFAITPNVSTTGKTVYAYLVDRGGTATQVGSAAGAGADVTINITLDMATSGIEGGTSYRLEVVANPTDANPVTLLPNLSYSNYWLDVFQVRSIAAD